MISELAKGIEEFVESIMAPEFRDILHRYDFGRYVPNQTAKLRKQFPLVGFFLLDGIQRERLARSTADQYPRFCSAQFPCNLLRSRPFNSLVHELRAPIIRFVSELTSGVGIVPGDNLEALAHESVR